MRRRCRLLLSPLSGSASRWKMGPLSSPMRRRTGWICGMNLRDYDVRSKKRIDVWKNWRGSLGGCSKQSHQRLRRRRVMDGWRLRLEHVVGFFFLAFYFLSLRFVPCVRAFFLYSEYGDAHVGSINQVGLSQECLLFREDLVALTEYYGVLLERSLVFSLFVSYGWLFTLFTLKYTQAFLYYFQNHFLCPSLESILTENNVRSTDI